MKNIVLILFCLSGAVISFSQNAEVSGTLMNKLTKETIAGVQLSVDNKVLTLTDLNGSFSIILQQGKRTIQFEINGKNQQLDLNIKETELDLGTVELDVTKDNHLKFSE